jgi:hypothetical protein
MLTESDHYEYLAILAPALPGKPGFFWPLHPEGNKDIDNKAGDVKQDSRRDRRHRPFSTARVAIVCAVGIIGILKASGGFGRPAAATLTACKTARLERVDSGEIRTVRRVLIGPGIVRVKSS